MFVTISRVRLCDDPRQFLDYEPHYAPEPEVQPSAAKSFNQKETVEEPPLNVGERVVWMSDYGPEHGVVKWVGFLHDTREREWTVGVEFVSKPNVDIGMQFLHWKESNFSGPGTPSFGLAGPCGLDSPIKQVLAFGNPWRVLLCGLLLASLSRTRGYPGIPSSFSNFY